MARRRGTVHREKRSEQVIQVGLDELLWPGVSTVDDSDWDTDEDVDAAPVDTQPVDIQPVDIQPVDIQPVGTRPADAQPAEHRRAEPRPAGASFGVAFFGWLVAGSTSVLLMALVGGVGTVIGWDELEDWSSGWLFVGLWALLVVSVAVGAFSGGYAAARMVPTHGAQQGLEVWLFSWFASAVLAGLGYLADREYDVVARIDWSVVPVAEPDRPRAALIAIAAILLVTLVGAVLGGASGTRK
ncbi:hypothetical protein [Kribbella sp. NPDC003557]|uniref:hypothetical protein n=1 Tax=Kribbella sp. NPDC003557 TaxID=3154449 RepID=UPI0033ACFBD0